MNSSALEVVVSGRKIPAWQERVLQQVSALGLARIRVTVRERSSVHVGATHNWLRRRIAALRLVPLPAGLERDDGGGGGSETDLVFDLSHCERMPTANAVTDGRPRLYFHSPDGCICSACLPFAAAVRHGRPATRLTLVLSHGPHSEAIVVSEGVWRTRPDRYRGFVEQVLGDVAAWPATAIRKLASQGLPLERSSTAQKFAVPRVTSLGLILGMALGTARHVWNDLARHEQWTLGIVPVPIEKFLEPGFKPQFRWRAPDGRRTYLADPFGSVSRDGVTVLAEFFDYARNRGEIVKLRYDSSTGWGEPQPYLALSHHLSYPYLFEHDGHRYVMPESFQAGNTRAFELSQDDKIAAGGILFVDGVAMADATVFEWQGHWWLLATATRLGVDSHLHAWFGNSPIGPWQPHAANPIKIDVGSARPAGTPFVVDGELYRPAQDCVRTYGARVVINRVLELTSDTFREIAVSSCEPEAQATWRDGLHTLSAIGSSYTVVDAKRHVFSPWAAASNIRGALGKLIRRRRRAVPPYNSAVQDSPR